MTRTQPEFRGDFPAADRDPWDGATFEMPAAPDTQPLDRLRAQPRFTPADPQPQHDPRDTGPMQRMPRLSRVQQRPRPARPYDAAIFAWSALIEQHVMLCGTCPPERRSRFADPIAWSMPFGFEALRVSAYVMGWRLDAFARWACPACQGTPEYRTPYGVIQWDPDAADAYLGHDRQGEARHRAAAELDLILDVAAAVSPGPGRHAAGAL